MYGYLYHDFGYNLDNKCAEILKREFEPYGYKFRNNSIIPIYNMWLPYIFSRIILSKE